VLYFSTESRSAVRILSFLAALALMLGCGNEHPFDPAKHHWDSLSVRVAHTGVAPGDHVNVLVEDRIVLHDIEVLTVHPLGRNDGVELNATPEEINAFVSARPSHLARLQIVTSGP
jgi:hypothetical protein